MKNKIALCAMIALSSAPQLSHAMYWGTEFTGSLWEMDGKEFRRDATTSRNLTMPPTSLIESDKLTQDKLGGFAVIFMEGKSTLRLGITVGYGTMPSVSYKRYINTSGGHDINIFRWNNETTYVPFDLYVKYKVPNSRFSFFAGGGVDYVMARTGYNYNYNNADPIPSNFISFTSKAEFAQNKFIPQVKAGGEWFITKWLSLNVGTKYLFNGTLDNLTGNVTEDGVSKGKNRMIMNNGFIYYKKTSEALATNERPFKYDLSGLRVDVGFRVYFK